MAQSSVAKGFPGFEATRRRFSSDPYRSLALHFHVGGAEEVHEVLDAAGLSHSDSVRIVGRQIAQGHPENCMGCGLVSG